MSQPKSVEILHETAESLQTEPQKTIATLAKYKGNGIELMNPFYCFFYCYAKRILMGEPFNQYYDVIGSYVYTTDGKYFTGYYNHRTKEFDDDLWGDYTDPALVYCCPCVCIQINCCYQLHHITRGM